MPNPFPLPTVKAWSWFCRTDVSRRTEVLAAVWSGTLRSSSFGRRRSRSRLQQCRAPGAARPARRPQYWIRLCWFLSRCSSSNVRSVMTSSRPAESTAGDVRASPGNAACRIVINAWRSASIRNPKVPARRSVHDSILGTSEGRVLHQNGRDVPMKRIDAAEAERIESLVAKKVESQSPSPGTEPALRRLIEGIRTGKPNYEGSVAARARRSCDRMGEHYGQSPKQWSNRSALSASVAGARTSYVVVQHWPRTAPYAIFWRIGLDSHENDLHGLGQGPGKGSCAPIDVNSARQQPHRFIPSASRDALAIGARSRAVAASTTLNSIPRTGRLNAVWRSSG